jgi:competence ComEA-like helix-hairpin-helix protein
MPRSLPAYFHFTRTERRGVMALLVLTAVIFILPEVLRWWRPHKPNVEDEAMAAGLRQFLQGTQDGRDAGEVPAAAFPFNPNSASLEELVALGLPEKLAARICRYREKGGQFRRPEDFQKMYGLSPAEFERLKPFLRLGPDRKQEAGRWAGSVTPVALELSEFDPNLASADDFRRLGVPAFLTERLVRYREHGGRFRKKEDLRKIYGFPPELFDRLEPYIRIGRSEGTGRAPVDTEAGHPRWPERPVQVIDINRATPEEWQLLPGIGPTRSEQIVRFREKLGGFVSIAQVAETRGLPDSVFQQIRDRLILASENVQKIRVNRVTVDELKAHPYFSARQASVLTAFRDQHGPFGQVEDISKIALLNDPAWLEKVRPYLSLE